jgi:hypothetical protein
MAREDQRPPLTASRWLLLPMSVGFLFVLIYTPMGGAIHSNWQRRQNEKRLQQRNDYPAIANACVQMIKQLGTNESQTFAGNNPSLPDGIARLQAVRVSAFTNQVKITFGGGFHHWGLLFVDGLAPTTGPALEFWSDSGDSKKLWP